MTLSKEQFATFIREATGIDVEDIVGEAVDHPLHYNTIPVECPECSHPIEVIEIVRHFNFNRGNVIKYVMRAGIKDPDKEVEDLEKAVWYLQDEINHLKRQKEQRQTDAS